LQAVVPDVEKQCGTLVAVTPHKGEHSLRMVRRHGLGFEMLSDPGNAYVARLGLRFQVPEGLKEVYLSRGIDLAESSGSSDWTLPVPARLVVDRTGVVRAADIDLDYTRRPEPEKTLADVEALG